MLFALLPIASLLAHNITQIRPAEAIRPAVLALGMMGVLWLICRLLFRDTRRAALATSIFLVLFFSFGHVYLGFLGPVTGAVFQNAGLVGSRGLLVGVWVGILTLAVVILARPHLPVSTMTSLFNIMASAALAWPLYATVAYELGLSFPLRDWPVSEPIPTSAPSTDSADPDIYYIILDGFARQDVLRDIYQVDDSGFVSSLEKMGFVVASQARTNYPQTALSMAASMNQSYLDPLAMNAGAESQDRLLLARAIRWSALRIRLEGRGYRFYAFESGSRTNELDNANEFLRPESGLPTNLERLALETSALVMFPEISTLVNDYEGNISARRHRDRILYTLKTLPVVAREPGPKFVFAHLISPHPPFILDRNGTLVDRDELFSFDDGNGYEGTQADYVEGYREQVLFLMPRIEQTVRSILDASPVAPVIILQADHGPGSRLAWNSREETDVRERFAILNAVLLPCAPENILPQTLTPVNTFRYVFQACFHLPYSPLPDHSYFSTWNRPFEFIEVPAAAIAPLDGPTTNEPGCDCGAH